jgi:hypothetical protein
MPPKIPSHSTAQRTPQPRPATAITPDSPSLSLTPTTPQQILQLQRAVGNAGVRQLLQRIPSSQKEEAQLKDSDAEETINTLDHATTIQRQIIGYLRNGMGVDDGQQPIGIDFTNRLQVQNYVFSNQLQNYMHLTNNGYLLPQPPPPPQPAPQMGGYGGGHGQVQSYYPMPPQPSQVSGYGYGGYPQPQIPPQPQPSQPTSQMTGYGSGHGQVQSYYPMPPQPSQVSGYGYGGYPQPQVPPQPQNVGQVTVVSGQTNLQPPPPTTALPPLPPRPAFPDVWDSNNVVCQWLANKIDDHMRTGTSGRNHAHVATDENNANQIRTRGNEHAATMLKAADVDECAEQIVIYLWASSSRRNKLRNAWENGQTATWDWSADPAKINLTREVDGYISLRHQPVSGIGIRQITIDSMTIDLTKFGQNDQDWRVTAMHWVPRQNPI